MSVCRSQALIHAPADRVWDLVGQPNRHPEWWPRVIEVRGERFDEGSTYAHWLLTEAQGETFVDVEFGMDPIRVWDRFLDLTVAKPYFRRWLEASLQGLERAAAEQPQPTENL